MDRASEFKTISGQKDFMKVLKIDRKNQEISCIAESMDDLWHLEKILSKGDIIFGSTDRKIKPSKEGEKAQRINLFIELEVMDSHFQEFGENLRINGIILGGKPEEFIELKSHQSIEIRVGDKIRIQKKELNNWQVDRIKKAEKTSVTRKLLVILLDDEQAEFAFVNNYSLSKKAVVKETKLGKRYVQEKSEYFDEILAKITSLAPEKILLAGPGFVKENLKRFIEDKKIKGLPAVLIENTNSVGETGFNELISQGKLEKIERELTMSKESQTIEEFLAKLSKGKAEYGKETIKKALDAGACEKLILSETYLMQNREEAEELLDRAEKVGCETEIISSRNPQEKQIFSFGGVVCTLRYKLE
ncbi:MAG: mRNA surveillance protein pelota [archaeon]|jgi:protein pelota